MRIDEKLPEGLQQALSNGLLKRIPLTFLPFVNQQLNQWEYLFPNERQSVERLLLYVASLSADQSTALFKNVVELEDKMGVRTWQFSTSEQTIQNSSQLAASPYFQEWRRAVQSVFDASDQYAQSASSGQGKKPNRLVLIDLPSVLPVDATAPWKRWQAIGKPMRLDLASIDSSSRPFETLVFGAAGDTGARTDGLFQRAQQRNGSEAAETWVLDAGMGLVDQVVNTPTATTTPAVAIVLGYARLDRYRESFSHEMNTMQKTLADADAVFDRLRKVDVVPWCPQEIAAQPATREFIRSLYLTGNGAVIFGNSFVQWAAAEAFRRARPTFLAAQFGMRTKPKPFTGVAVFNDPDKVNPLPSVDDPMGSALDAQMLALYVWLSASRYDEYQRSTVCVCMAESLSQAYVIAPPEFAKWPETEPVKLDSLKTALHEWIS